MPWTATLFGIGAAAISGLPPLNGFISEWLVYLGLFDAVVARGTAAIAAIPAAVLLAATGALALACFVKVCGVVFLGVPRSDAAKHAHEAGWRMRVPMLLLAFACALIGLLPVLFMEILAEVCDVWQPAWNTLPLNAALHTLSLFNLSVVSLLLLAIGALFWRVKQNGFRRALTWDCGYAYPSARMQYTAGSFAGILTSWFSWILRPQRRESLPTNVLASHASFEEHTPETVLEHVVDPIGAGVMRVSTAVRRLQHGRVQMYIVYLIAGVIALALVAWSAK
jgi:hydrogenase-4 component B